METQNPGGNVTYVDTYVAMKAFVDAYRDGHFHLIVVVGTPGLAKTRMFKAALKGKRACFLDGNATPFGLYSRLSKAKDRHVVFDDLDSIYRERKSLRLLKALAQNEPRKEISWNSSPKALEEHKLKVKFTTGSPVAIIANEWKTLNENVAALEDRGHVIFFQPTPAEVHAQVASWFGDREVFDYVGENLESIAVPSMRLYVRAGQLKAAGMGWKHLIRPQGRNARERLALELHQREDFASTEDRVREFVARGGGGRATYFNIIKRAGLSGKLTPAMKALPAPEG